MTTVDRIVTLCKTRGIAIARMEKACGFANGYIRNLRSGNVPSDRLVKIAEYLQVTTNYLLTGETYSMNGDLSEEERDLLSIFRTFNAEGKRELLKRITEMSFIPAYREDLSQKSYPSQSVG